MHEVELLKAKDELMDAQSYIIALQAECNEWKQKAQEATRQRTAIPSAPDSNSSPTTELSGSSVAGNGVSSENDAGSNAIGASGSTPGSDKSWSPTSSPSPQPGAPPEQPWSCPPSFGPSWTAVELLPMLVKQVSSPSSERRTCVANMMRAMVDLLDLSTQAHVVLTQLHRLSEDRIEQFSRKGPADAIHTALTSSLLPVMQCPATRTPADAIKALKSSMFRRSLPATRPRGRIHTALTSSLPPVMQMWVINSDVIGTSLVPKLITEMGRHMEAATSGGGPRC
eukprot:gene15329-21413_t